MKKFSLFAALLAAGASVWAAGPENLLKNPGFETDSPDWLAWGIYRKLTPEERASILTFDTDMPGSGKRSMRVADRWTDDGPYMVQIVPFPAGKPLKLSFRARAPKGQEFRYGAQFGTGTGMRDFRYVDARYARGVGDGGWHEYELLLEPPGGATLVAAAFCPGSKTTAGTLWVDDAALRVLGEADEAAALGIDREPVFRENLPYQPADGSKPGAQSDSILLAAGRRMESGQGHLFAGVFPGPRHSNPPIRSAAPDWQSTPKFRKPCWSPASGTGVTAWSGPERPYGAKPGVLK